MSAASWALYDSPELAELATREAPAGQRELTLHIRGVHCGGCVNSIRRALPDGVTQFSADPATGVANLRFDSRRVRLSGVLAAIENAGFHPQPVHADVSALEQVRSERRWALARLGVAMLLGMQVMMLASGEYFGDIDAAMRPLLRYAQWLLATPVALFAGWPMLRGGWRSLMRAAPTMDTPVAVAITGAYLISAYNSVTGHGAVYFDSVAMFVLLLSLARFLEGRGRAQAAQRQRGLADAQPLVAQVRRDDGVFEVPAAQLVAGDTVLVAPGDALPADGRLLDDLAEVDESLMSGEAEPVVKRAGDVVLAASVNVGDAPLRLSVERIGADTALSQLTRMVHRAQLERPRVQVAADKVASVFVAGVLVVAAAALLVWWAQPPRAIQAALAVLVVTCPCALSLAVPVALAAATSRLARTGVLLVHPDALMRLGEVTRACLDKTGTLTTRAMTIVDSRSLGELSVDECLMLAAALEKPLNHPIARAFAAHAGPRVADDVRSEPGRGVYGRVDGRDYALEPVAPALAHDTTADPLRRWFQLSESGRPLALFALVEDLRPHARQAVHALREHGCRVSLLSGDRSASPVGVGGLVGADEVHAGVVPEDKLAYLRRAQGEGHRVLALGDGINDGPLLAGADVSVGIASGAALAQAHGDAILLSESLDGIADMLDVGRATRRVIRQNFAWAVLYNVTMVPVAFAGALTPWVAALGMGISSLIVTLNGLRLLRVRQRFIHAQETS